MGSFSILNNIAGLNAQSQLNVNNISLTRTLLRFSSGKRVNSGADDAAGLRDPGNLGTLFRSAAATGVQAVLRPPETVDAFSPKVVRSGMGAHFRLPIRSMTWDEIRKLTHGLAVYLADMDGRSCWETDLRKPLAFIVGGEAEGASPEAQAFATDKISIPMTGNVESLNAGVAGSVLMFETVRQHYNV